MKKVLILLSTFVAAVASGYAATFDVEVPDGTKKCYVCGKFNGWSADDAIELSASGSNRFTVELPDVSDADVAGGFKYLCGRDWAYVEKKADGGEMSNRLVAGSPDVVGKWAAMPDWDIETMELTVNSIKREVRVYLPQGYAESDATYPVIYYNTVQQRYNNAGDDADRGDDFFGSASWNAHNVMEELRADGGKPYILVQVQVSLQKTR